MEEETVRLKMKKLAEDIQRYTDAYYLEDRSLVPDQVFDELLKELEGLEKKYPSLADPNSPTQRVGGGILKKFESFPHIFPMLSLPNTYEESEIQEFIDRTQKYFPQMYTKREEASVLDLMIITVTTYLIIGFMVFLIFLLIYLLTFQQEFLLYLIIPIYMFSQLVFFLELTKLRSKMDFLGYSIVYFFKSLIIVLGIYLMSHVTTNIIWLISLEIIVTILFSYSIYSTYFNWALNSYNYLANLQILWKRYIGGGLRLLLSNGVLFALLSLDKWWGVFLLSDKEYGIYSFGLILLTIFDTCQQILNISLYAYFGKLFAAKQSNIAYKMATCTFIVLILLGGLFYIPCTNIIEWSVVTFFPKYNEALTVMNFIFLAGLIRCTNFFSSYCIMADLEIKLSVALLFFAAILSLGILVLSFLGIHFDLQRIALLPLIIALIVLMVSFLFAFNHHNQRQKMVLTYN